MRKRGTLESSDHASVVDNVTDANGAARLQAEALSVDVIIPTVNEAPAIAAAVHRAVEACASSVIVVDGDSNDETQQRALEAGATVLRAPVGRGAQLQAGATASSADILLFLHADLRVDAHHLRDLTEAVSTGRIAGCFRQQIEASGSRYRLLEWGNAFRAKRFGWIYGDQAMFIRRDVFERMGGFKPIPLMEDLEFSKRLKREGKAVVLDRPIAVNARRWQKQGVLFSTLRNWSFVVLFHFGVSPKRLAKWYRNIR